MNYMNVSKHKLLLLTICLLVPSWIFSVELPVENETVFTENNLQAMVGYFIEGNFYSGGILPFYANILGVGDHYYWDFPNINVCERFYLSFSIQPVPEHYSIDSVVLKLYQNYCCGDGGDNVYPLFYGNQISCMIDHVDYGLTFEYSDFNPTIYGTIGAISSELTYGWKELNITNAYLQDLNQSRPYCQVMCYFPIMSDYDFMSDNIDFRSSYFPDPVGTPQIVITYQPVNHASDDALIATYLVSVYPNPCRDNVTITTKNNSKLIKAELFNLKGQRIKSSYTQDGGSRVLNITIDNDIAPGIYLLKYSSINAGKIYKGTIKLLMQK